MSCMSLIGNLVEDKNKLALQVDNIIIQFCRRSANTVADKIVKQVAHDYIFLYQ